jgi:hypothetical protein
MKTRKFALFAFALLALGITAQKAQAQTFTCDGGSNPVPANVTGNAVVQQTGNCSIAAGITATGAIDITITGGTLTVGAGLQGTTVTASTSATSNDITTQAITATNGTVSVTSGGKVTTTNLTSTPGDILISAPGNVSTNVISAGSNFGIFTQTGTGTIKITGTVTTGTFGGGNVLLQSNGNIDVTSNITAPAAAVEIEANMNQATSTVFKIGASSSNGVNGTIRAANGVFVVNGNTSATGGITITNGNKINTANATATNPGSILLNAQNGTLTLSAGTLSVNGASGQAAGLIILMGNVVSAGGSTTITASQANSVAGSVHYVAVAANSLSVAGTTIQANGNGISTNPAQVDFGTPGWISFSSNEDVDFMMWTVTNNGTLFTTHAQFAVSGTGALTVNANGSTNNVEIAIGGYPIVFSNAGNVTLQSKGNGTFTAPHLIQISYFGTLNSTPGLTFNNTGTVLIDASGNSGNNAGGQIQIQLDQFSVASSVTSFTMHADGLGTGNAGIVGFFPSKATFSDATTLITANGAGSTSLSSPNINFGVSGATTVNSTTFTVSANGLPSANKNAGIVTFSSNPITLASNTTASITANGPTSANGAGGTITLNPAFGGTLKLGGNPGDLSLSAKGGAGTGTGNNGGTIIVNNAPAITLDTAQATALNVSVPGGTGNGGTITIFPSSMTFTGSGYALNANSGTTQGNGGTITIGFATTASLNVGTGAGAVQISATGQGTGNGGTVSLTAGSLTVAGGSINVSAGTGNGGNITANASGSLTVTGTLDADGGCQGNGGTVTLQSSNTNVSSATVDASGGAGTMCAAVSPALFNPRQSTSTNGGVVTFDGNGGPIRIGASQGAIITAKSDASGNGGTVQFKNNSSVSFDASNVNMSAGTSGNGGTLTVQSTGNITITGSGATISLTAGQTSGNGGTVDISTQPGAISISPSFNVSAANGIGGQVSIVGNTLSIPNAVTINANGGGSGIGGAVVLGNNSTSQALTIANLTVTANDGSSASGNVVGLVSIGSAGAMTLNGSSFTATSQNIPGTIKLTAATGTLTLDQATSVDGGEIDLTAASIANNGVITGRLA